MSRLFQGERRSSTRSSGRSRRWSTGSAAFGRTRSSDGRRYTASVLAFSLFAFLIPYAFMRLQGLLPLNPQGFGAAR